MMLACPQQHFFLIGAMKAGTSSMYEYLAAHPAIYAAPRKEPRLFAKPGSEASDLSACAALFAGRTSETWAFEASTAYTKYPMISGVPERIHATFPDARLIYLIRDPIERICSAYLHNLAEGRERRPLEEAVFEGSQEYLNVSRYHLQLSQYLRVFPHQQILVLLFEEFVADIEMTLGHVARFLELEPGFGTIAADRRSNETARKRAATPVLAALKRVPGYDRLPWKLRRWTSERMTRPLPAKSEILNARVRGRILEALDDDVAQLKELLGRDLSCWKLAPKRDTVITTTD